MILCKIVLTMTSDITNRDRYISAFFEILIISLIVINVNKHFDKKIF